MARVDVEWLAFVAGLKPAVRRTVDPARADEVEARMRADGAAVVRAGDLARFGQRVEVVLYAARDLAAAQSLRDAEAPVLPGRAGSSAADAGAHRAVGLALGFPPCCVDAFAARLARGVDRLVDGGPGGFAEDYVALRSAWVPRPDARVNPLLMRAGAQLVSFYPCRFDCPAAVAVATSALAAVARRAPEVARSLEVVLARSVVVAPDGARAQVAVDVGGAVSRAVAPTRDGRAEPADEALAASLAVARVGGDGAVADVARVRGEPPWCADFGWRARA